MKKKMSEDVYNFIFYIGGVVTGIVVTLLLIKWGN